MQPINYNEIKQIIKLNLIKMTKYNQKYEANRTLI